ncbi:MAG: VWA domain-containing protein [Bacillota bacterium]|nr:VWA domain-containing protein [Bacillota bacterium]
MPRQSEQLLSRQVLRFAGALRRAGFLVGPGESADALSALEVVSLDDREAMREALRLVFTTRPEEAPVFDALFDLFFREPGAPPPPGGASAQPDPFRRGDDGAPAAEGEGEVGLPERSPGGGGRAEAERPRNALYSPAAGRPGGEAAVPAEQLEPVLAAARALALRVRLGRSRRWRPSRHGRRFAFRQTLRHGLETDGEWERPYWLGHPPRRPRFVLLLDASRSMAAQAGLMLQLGYALLRSAQRVEVFLFSTALRRVTRELRTGGPGRLPTLRGLGAEWGGGTRIGAALEGFLKGWGDRLLGRETVVLILSDGLDTGEVDRLERAMREIHRRSAGVVWLNPLLSTPGYRPLARGMRAALPYVDTFADAHDATALTALAERLRLRR